MSVTLPQLAERANIEYRTAHAWVDRGLLVPTVAATGSGSRMKFSEQEARVAVRLGQARAVLNMDGLEAFARLLRMPTEMWRDASYGVQLLEEDVIDPIEPEGDFSS